MQYFWNARRLAGVAVFFAGIFLMAVLLAGSASAQVTPTTPVQNNGSAAPMDVLALVNAVGGSPTRASIALAYRQRIPHSRVTEELQRLQKASGWTLGTPEIADDSTHPKDRRFPITTSALVMTENAQPIVNNAPALLPFLRAFQKWNRVELLISGWPLDPSKLREAVDTPALSVRLLQREGGVLRYQVEIHDHNGELTLPALNETGASPQDAPSAATASHSPAVTRWPLILAVVGLALIGMAAAYLRMAQRASARSSARIVRR